MTKPLGLAGRMAAAFIQSKLTPLIVAASILLGLGAVWLLPREEEPQIIVPMVDIFVRMQGASAREVEERITKPMEKLLWEIPGVEYVYSTSSPGRAMAIVRFYVGEDEEKCIVRLNQKMFANFDLIPPGASQPLIKPRAIDDVPILTLTLWSAHYDAFLLRRMAAQLHDAIKEVKDVSEVRIYGGERRQVRVLLDPGRLAARQINPAGLLPVLAAANGETDPAALTTDNRDILLDTKGFLRTAEEVGLVVVGVFDGRPVYLRDVAAILDGPEEARSYVRFGQGPAAPLQPESEEGRIAQSRDQSTTAPAITLSVAKRKGANAIDIANQVLKKVEGARRNLIPSDVHITETRNYGETSAEKANELLFHMALAILSVTLLVYLALGLRGAGIVAIAIPVTLALTLAVFFLYGYTLNRITLFALIFSIGILVDDAIVVVENIVRHFRLPENQGRPIPAIILAAVDEVGNPTILASLTVIAAIVPMAFVRGLMGPYMRPIPVGASAAMFFSLLVAFVVTPWASLHLLKRTEGTGHASEGRSTRLYRKVMRGLLEKKALRAGFLGMVVLLLLLSCSLVAFKLVKVKMLPFDNKSEFQIIIDTAEGATLEETAAIAGDIAATVANRPEVANYQTYVGLASPFNFNGLVRHYYLRQGPNVADIQVNLAPKGQRHAQSHEIAKEMRPLVAAIAKRHNARVKIAEVPPGPPVLQTLVAEVYGPDYDRQVDIARQIKTIFEETGGVVDVDWFVEDPQERVSLAVDRGKAALHGVSSQEVAFAIQLATGGVKAGLLHDPREKEDVDILVGLPRPLRSDVENILVLRVGGQGGQLVALRELVRLESRDSDRSIYHKNLMPVVYVTADLAGEEESPVYAILKLNQKLDQLRLPEGYTLQRHVARLPFSTDSFSMKWDGEWHITYEVFRDLGLAFATVLVLIYILVVGWFQSFKTPFAIMAAIPFSLVGILPAHGLMGAFFTATSMIGFIAGAGIVVRNSVILVDFIELRLAEGMPLADAVVDAGAVRFRPMVLTAAAVIAGAGVILFDPIFQGLAISLMAGEVASLLLSRMTVPILYYLSARNQ